MAKKITDTALLDAIWIEQLKVTARGPVGHYVGDTYGLMWGERYGRDSWKYHGVTQSRAHRERITDLITPAQILKRLRDLKTKGLIEFYLGDIKSFCTFHIDSPQAKKAWDVAYSFWQEKGLSGVSGESIPLSNPDELKAECEQLLLDNFSLREQKAA